MRAFDKVRGSMLILAVTSVLVFSPTQTAFSGKPILPPPPPQEPEWAYVPEVRGWVGTPGSSGEITLIICFTLLTQTVT